jgi:hypothetical protein
MATYSIGTSYLTIYYRGCVSLAGFGGSFGDAGMVGLSGSTAEPQKGASAGQAGQAVLPGFIRSRFAGIAWDFNQRPPG